MITMEEEFLTVREISERLRIDEETIKRMLRKGQMPGYKIGGVWRIDRKDFTDYLARQKNTQK